MYDQKPSTVSPPQFDDFDEFMSKRKTATPKAPKAAPAEDFDDFMSKRATPTTSTPFSKAASKGYDVSKYPTPVSVPSIAGNPNAKQSPVGYIGEPSVNDPNSPVGGPMSWTGTKVDSQGRPGRGMVRHEAPAPTGQFKSPVSMDFRAPTDVEQMVNRSQVATGKVAPAPTTGATGRSAFQQIKPRRSALDQYQDEQATQRGSIANSVQFAEPQVVTPEERRTAAEKFYAQNELDKAARQAEAKARVEAEAARAPKDAFSKIGGHFVRGAVKGVTAPLSMAAATDKTTLGRQAFSDAVQGVEDTAAEYFPVDRTNPATLNVFKPEFYSLSNIGRAATENVPETIGQMLPAIALSRGAGAAAGLAAPELAGATALPRLMPAVTGAELASRTAAGAYGAMNQAQQAYQNAIAAGFSHDEALRAAAMEAPIGASEFLGSPGTTGAVRPRTVIGREMKEEGLQELGQNVAGDLMAKYGSGYAPNKSLTDIAGEGLGSGALGAAVGGLGALPGAAREGRMTRAENNAVRSESAPMPGIRPTTLGPTQITPLTRATAAAPPATTTPAIEPTVTTPITPELSANPPVAAESQSSAFPRLPEPEGFNARRAKLLGIGVPAEVGINERLQQADKLANSPNENDQKLGKRMLKQTLADIQKSEGYQGEIGLPDDAPKPYTAVRQAIEERLKPAPKQAEPEPVAPSTANAPTAELPAPRISDTGQRLIEQTRQKADVAIEEGRYGDAILELKAHQQALKDAKTAARKSPGLRVQLERQIGQVGNRIGEVRKMDREARKQANAPTKPATFPQTEAPQVQSTQPITGDKNADISAPLLRPEAVQNPEGGIPQMPEQTFSGRLDQGIRKDAAEQAKPQRVKADTDLSPIEYLKRKTNRQGFRVTDKGEARRIGSKEAGIIGLTNKKSKWSVRDAQVMLDEGGFTMPDGRAFTDGSVTEHDVLTYLDDFGKQQPMNTGNLEQRLKDKEAAHWAQQEEAANEPYAPVDEKDYIPQSTHYKEHRNTYFADGKELLSTQNPQTAPIPPVGSWMIDDGYKALDGREIYQLVSVPIDNIEVSEDTGPQKWGNVKQYAQWLKEGKEAPPIRLTQTDKGTLRTMDHRRLMAAKAVGQKEIKAWVSRATISDRQGNPVAGMTYELAQKGHQPIPIAEAREDWKILPGDAKALERIKAELTEEFTKQPSKSFDQIDEEVRGRRRPPAPARPQIVGNRPMTIDVAGTRTPSAMSAEFPRARRAMVQAGREVEARLEMGQEKGGYGNYANAMYKSIAPGVPHGQDSFFNDPDLKGKLGLTRDVSVDEVKKELNSQLARSLGVTVDEVSLSHIKPEVWRAWARQKGLGKVAMQKLEAGINKAERKENAIKTNAKIVAEESQRGKEELRQPEGKASEPAPIKTGDAVTWQSNGKTISGKVTKVLGQYVTAETADGEMITRHKSKFTAAPIIAERKTAAPFTDRYTVKDLAENATAEYRPARNRPGTVYLNDWGHALLADTIVNVYGEKHSGVSGDLTISASTARNLADKIRERANGEFAPIAEALETAASDADANGRDVAIVTHRPGQAISRTKTNVRHETTHAGQSAIDDNVTGAATDSWLDRQPKAKQIREGLTARGYAPDTHGYEAVAFTASGEFDALGLSLNEAEGLLDSYYRATVRKYGASALEKFGAIDPKLQPTLERAKDEAGIRRTATERSANNAGRTDRGATIRARQEEQGDIGGNESATQGRQERAAEVPAVSRRTREDVENSPAFKRWFGDSKVVDKNGKPLVVYHGTQSTSPINEVDFSRLDKNALFGPGFYTTQDATIAGGDGGYALTKSNVKGKTVDGNPHTYPLYLNIKKPFYADSQYSPPRIFEGLDYKPSQGVRLSGQDAYKEIVRLTGSKQNANDHLRKMGYDGITHVGGNGAIQAGTRSFRTEAEAKDYALKTGGSVESSAYVQPVSDRLVEQIGAILRQMPTSEKHAFWDGITEKAKSDMSMSGVKRLLDDINSGTVRGLAQPDLVELGLQFVEDPKISATLSDDFVDHLQLLDDMLENRTSMTYTVKGHRVWIAFSPNQIKSATGNRGTFDTTLPKISERKEKRASFGELENEPRGQVLASGFNIQDLFSRKSKDAKPERQMQLPKDWKIDDWAKKTYTDAMVNALSPKDRAEYDKATTEREKKVFLLSAAVDGKIEARVFELIDKASEAAAKGDNRAVMEAVRDAREYASAPATNLEKLSALRKASMLLRPVTHARNLLGNTVFQPLEEAARIPGSIADSAIGLITGRRTIKGANPAEMMRATSYAATEGLQQAKDAMHGLDPEDLEKAFQVKEIKFKNRIIDKAVKFSFRSLNAEDKIFYTYAYDRALREQAKLTALNERKNGIIGRKDQKARAEYLHSNPTVEMDVDATTAAEVAVFRNKNILSTGIQSARTAMGDKGAFAVDLILPFDKTPTNIIARTLEYTPLGGVIAASKAVAFGGRTVKEYRAARKEGAPSKQAIKEAIDKAMTPAQQRAFSMLVGRSTVGTVAPIALGYFLASLGMATGAYDEDDRKENAKRRETNTPPSSIKIGGRWYQIGGLPPLGSLIAMGATLHEEVNKEGSDAESVILGTAKGVGGIASDVPLLRSTKDAVEGLTKEGRAGQKVGRIASSFVPSLLSDIGQITPGLRDEYERQTRSDKKVKGFAKFGRDVGGEVAGKIPGLRKMLPIKTDGSGRKIETELSDPFDPFSSRPALDSADLPGFKGERSRIGLSNTELKQKTGEPDAIYRQRVDRVSGWTDYYGGMLLNDPRYQSLPPDMQEAAIQNLRKRIGRQQNIAQPKIDRRTGQIESFTPGKVLEGVQKSARERPKKDAKKLWVAPPR